MKKKISSFLMLLFFVFMTACLLIMPKTALALSLEGLNLWFLKMIPALLPFMILSGILIRMDLSDSFARLFSGILKPLFKVNQSCIYVIVIGFLCGFPMGARVCAESLQQKKITQKEAQYLLSFCNNIGPVYMTGYVMELFPVQNKVLFLIGTYGIPLMYGLFLRYTRCRHSVSDAQLTGDRPQALPFFAALNQSILSGLDGITVLGGYMIFGSLLNIIPMVFCQNISRLLPAATNKNPYSMLMQISGGLLEITSGLARIKTLPFWIPYSMLCFGGLSCIAQTSSCIKDTGLSLKWYIYDKTVQTFLSVLYFLFIEIL